MKDSKFNVWCLLTIIFGEILIAYVLKPTIIIIFLIHVIYLKHFIILVAHHSQLCRYSFNCRPNITYSTYWWYGQFTCTINDGTKKKSYTWYL